jgi:UDP:flavonoid glycosyltransferase YjiC (YdhE family)
VKGNLGGVFTLNSVVNFLTAMNENSSCNLRLAKSIEEYLSDAAMRYRAKEISELIQARDSLGRAVRLIESEFAS